MMLSGNFPENKWLSMLTSSYNDIAFYEDKLGNLESAKKYYQKSIETLNVERAENSSGNAVKIHLGEIQTAAFKRMKLMNENGGIGEACFDFDLWLATREAKIRRHWFPENDELTRWKKRCAGKVSPYRSVVEDSKKTYYF